MFELWYYSLVLCVLCYSAVRPERCPSHCTQDGGYQKDQDCGQGGLCCGWHNNLYCCVHYYDRVNVTGVVDVVAEDCIAEKQSGGVSPSYAVSHVLLVGVAVCVSVLTCNF
ncbi:hypothetical protein LSAT2_004206 [Lamellibrachia satsuma]|nr:hypothetical protein LSAT2_004206 [Lamellibrachia satsuma]